MERALQKFVKRLRLFYKRFAIKIARDYVRQVAFSRLATALVVALLLFLLLHGCTRSFLKTSTTLCVAIFSTDSKEGLARRAACRETWLALEPSSNDNEFKWYFFLGQLKTKYNEALAERLQIERQTFGDIVVLPILDTYQNLTLKLLQAITFLWNNEDCKFIFKADDDTFARIDLMLSELSRLELEHWLYWGYFTGRARVFHSGKWAEKNWFLCDRYLPYARGGGYVFSKGIANFIVKYADLLQRYTSEDVSFGVWTAGLALNRVHDVRFDTEYQSRGCLNSYLVTHKQSPAAMREKAASLLKHGHLCAAERAIRLPYAYRWDSLPSQCCETLLNVSKLGLRRQQEN